MSPNLNKLESQVNFRCKLHLIWGEGLGNVPWSLFWYVRHSAQNHYVNEWFPYVAEGDQGISRGRRLVTSRTTFIIQVNFGPSVASFSLLLSLLQSFHSHCICLVAFDYWGVFCVSRYPAGPSCEYTSEAGTVEPCCLASDSRCARNTVPAVRW